MMQEATMDDYATSAPNNSHAPAQGQKKQLWGVRTWSWDGGAVFGRWSVASNPTADVMWAGGEML